MGTFSLAAYTIRIEDTRSNTFLILDNFINSLDFYSIIDHYLSARHSNNPSVIANSNKILKVKHFDNQGDRMYVGIIETGEYGYEADLYDINRNQTTYTRQPTEAEMLPFYFLISIPSNKDEGILILQRFKQFGIKTIFENDLKNFIKSYVPADVRHINLTINALVPSRVLEYYLRGDVKKIRFIKFSLPSDIANFYDDPSHIEEEGYMELVVSANRGRYFPNMIKEKIRRLIRGESDLSHFIEIRDLNYDYDNVKVELDIQGTRRTIDLSNTSALKGYIDITSDVSVGPNGHPEFTSINQIALEIYNELITAIRYE